MIPSKYAAGQSSAIRKTRVDGKHSMLPKPRRPGSTDRLSTEARRPSTAGHRSSSAEPPRATIGGGRLSREASATKLSTNPRSRSQQSEMRYGQRATTPLHTSQSSRTTATPLRSRQQQSEMRYGQPTTTPLRSSHYSRTTMTPLHTPLEDRSKRSWQTCLERALAFVTVKDQRPLSSAEWWKAEMVRVDAALSARSEPGCSLQLVRPLPIARFVEIIRVLVQSITMENVQFNTENYMVKIQNHAKRLLYPGTISKSWLKTVNTLYTFPQAVGLISYLVDLANYIETPVSDEWLYPHGDDLACLRRKYLHKCWIRFQCPDSQFDDLNKEYLESLKMLLGNDDAKIVKLQQEIQKYEAWLEDEAEAAARAEEARLRARREALGAALRAQRTQRLAGGSARAALRAARADLAQAQRQLDADMERAQAESQRLADELALQPLSVAERTRLLDEVDYALRVHDSKRALADQIAKMVLSKETELALWQKKTLDSCVEYKQGLIHLSAEFPELSAYAIDENELMDIACSEKVTLSVIALREKASAMGRLKSARAAERAARRRQRARLVEESQARICELKSLVEAEQQALQAEVSKENAEALAWSKEKREMGKRIEALAGEQEKHDKAEAELLFWQKQDDAWQEKLSAMKKYIELQRVEAERVLQKAKEKRCKLIMDNIKLWNEKLAH